MEVGGRWEGDREGGVLESGEVGSEILGPWGGSSVLVGRGKRR